MKNKSSSVILILLIVILALVTYFHHSAEEPEASQISAPDAVISVEPNEQPPLDNEIQTTPDVVTTPEATPTPTPSPTPTPTPEPYADKPDIDITSWEYLLVNAENNIGDYVPELTTLEGSHKFDSRAVESLIAFIDAARAEGLSVFLSSSYRPYSEQEYLYNRKVAQYGDPAVAATIVAPPGTSEHQSGLCADITDIYYATKDRSLENTALFKWMKANCQDYGFILRYPDGKQDVTGIIYEPWHFRYVGVEAATYIMENDLTLEEFVELYK